MGLSKIVGPSLGEKQNPGLNFRWSLDFREWRSEEICPMVPERGKGHFQSRVRLKFHKSPITTHHLQYTKPVEW